MTAIILQFLGAGDLPSELIEWFTEGNVAHVDAVLPDGKLLGARHDVVGGAPAGVQIRTPGYKKANLIVRASLHTSDADYVAFVSFLHAQIGKPYDSEGIKGFVAGRDWRDERAWFCSELQAAALEKCGECPPLYAAANKVTPAGLLLVASALGAIITKHTPKTGYDWG